MFTNKAVTDLFTEIKTGIAAMLAVLSDLRAGAEVAAKNVVPKVMFKGVKVLDDTGRFVLMDILIDPRFVIRMAQDAIKGPTPSSWLDVTIITQAFVDASGHKAQTDVVFGMPEDIADKLAIGFEKIPFVAPVPRIIAETPAQAAAIAAAAGGMLAFDLDLAGKSLMRDTNGALRDSPVFATAPSDNCLLIIKNWKQLSDGHREFWSAKKEGQTLALDEGHSSGFRIAATGFVAFKFEGDEVSTKVADL